MDLDELRRELVGRGVNSMDYRINEPPDEGAWCLKKQGKVWLVYFSERGRRRDLRRFSDESLACQHFLNQLTQP
jgi:hypothetical protein